MTREIEEKSEIGFAQSIHELFSHLERERRWFSLLCICTMIISAWIAIGYLWMLSLPFIFKITTVEVHLTDYANIGISFFIFLLAAIWFYLALKEYVFLRRWGIRFRKLMNFESQLEKETGESTK